MTVSDAFPNGRCDACGNGLGYDRQCVTINCSAYNTDRLRVTARFTPQAWVNDNAIDVDPQGDQEWDATIAFRQMDDDYREALLAELVNGDEVLDDRDMLKSDPHAPEWVREYQGPFSLFLRAEDAATVIDDTDDKPEWDPDDSDTKGEMVFVYRSDLAEFLAWYAAKGVDESDMNPRQAEALEALWADSEA